MSRHVDAPVEEGPKSALTVRNSISRPLSAAFGNGSGRARNVLGPTKKTLTGHLGGRELSSARRLASLACRRAAPHRRPSGDGQYYATFVGSALRQKLDFRAGDCFPAPAVPRVRSSVA